MTNYRYNIFISSTFRDMDAERDVIKYNVLPLLNERYRKYGVEFHVIDLRFGVNTENMTEEDSENAVLDVVWQRAARLLLITIKTKKKNFVIKVCLIKACPDYVVAIT